MISKEKIAKIIREKTWVEVDSARVYGIEEAAEKVLQAIEAAELGFHGDLAISLPDFADLQLADLITQANGEEPPSA